jgi:hypothetical protein
VIYAFADPIPPGKTDDVRRFYAELCGARKADYDEIALRSGVTEEWYWLQTGSEGDLMVVASSSDQQAFDAILAEPQTDFERWLREQSEEIFGLDPSLRQGIRNELFGTMRV